MSKKWNIEEDNKLKELVASGMTTEEIARKLDRTFRSVMHRRAGLIRPQSLVMQPKEEKIKPKELDKIIIQTLKDELIKIEPYKSSNQSKADLKGDTLCIHLTDLHAGKIVKNQEGELVYNEDIFRHRINRLCEQTLKLLDNNISKGVPIRDVVIMLSGDLANGEGIYATQAFEQECAPPTQVMLVVDVITKLIVALLNRKLSVKVYGVRGNHGRTGKDTDVASNWDLMIYMILDFWSKFVLKNSKLQIKYAETEHFVFNIRGHNFMIRHIAPEQVDSPAGRVKINEWARQHNLKGIVYGHYHHAGIFDCDNVRVFRGGSTVGGDSLSDSMAKHSEPIQILWGINEQRVSTFIYFVDLGGK
ncbi:MAG: metallophosphoesterase [Candidatus Margulisbacteria bacterium]|nr:metallophosphoesterase [Candidatus Margulisiibacteriota bacterium]